MNLVTIYDIQNKFIGVVFCYVDLIFVLFDTRKNWVIL